MSVLPTTAKGLKTRARILELARVIIGENGYVGFQMQDIAFAAGLSQGAMYRYFDDKTDLFLTLISDVHKALYEASRGGLILFKDDPYQAIHDSNRGYLQTYFDNRDIMKAFVEATLVEPRAEALMEWMRERHKARFCGALKRDFDISHINGAEAAQVIDALIASVEQSAFVWYALKKADKPEVSIDDASMILSNIWYRMIWPGTVSIPSAVVM